MVALLLLVALLALVLGRRSGRPAVRRSPPTNAVTGSRSVQEAYETDPDRAPYQGEAPHPDGRSHKKRVHLVLARYKEPLDHWLRCVPWLAQEYDITVWIANKFYKDDS